MKKIFFIVLIFSSTIAPSHASVLTNKIKEFLSTSFISIGTGLLFRNGPKDKTKHVQENMYIPESQEQPTYEDVQIRNHYMVSQIHKVAFASAPLIFGLIIAYLLGKRYRAWKLS